MNGPVYLSGCTSGLPSHELVGVMVQPGNSTHRAIDQYGWWAADNGCYAAGGRFDAVAWLEWLATLTELPPSAAAFPPGFLDQADELGEPVTALDHHLFATLPDVVGDWRATWRRSEPHIDSLRCMGYWTALVAQDGLTPGNVDWDGIDVLFIGGTTAWKESEHVVRLVHEAHYWGRNVHMGRVNSWRRYRHAASIGVDSVDGTFLAYGPDVNLPRMLRWIARGAAQPSLFASEEYQDTAPIGA